jgi:hypothetical protein
MLEKHACPDTQLMMCLLLLEPTTPSHAFDAGSVLLGRDSVMNGPEICWCSDLIDSIRFSPSVRRKAASL